MNSLSKISTRAPKELDKKEIKNKTENMLLRLQALQAVLFAESKRSVLIVLQGLDASGKDGAVKNVFSGVNPMGCRVQAFKKPTPEEFSYDFLWRVHRHTPAKGMIQIFNRSHYEDILVPTVHKLMDKSKLKRRYSYINAFEQVLQDNDTLIFKFYLHISQEEQQERFKERVKLPEKRWKYQKEDLQESKLWENYMDVYEEIFEKCSPEIPWQIIPSDQNWYKDYLIAKAVVERLEKCNMRYPDLKK